MDVLKFKIMKYLQTQNWQRIGRMLCVGVVAVFIAVYFSDDSPNSTLFPGDQTLPSNNDNIIATKNTANPIMNSKNNPSEVPLKDPFKIPAKFKALTPPQIDLSSNPNTANNNVSNNNVGNNKEVPKLKLTGIVGTGATREAIVEVSGKSRSYKKMDIIIDSPYQLIYMTDSAAVFRDSRGEKTTLTVGR